MLKLLNQSKSVLKYLVAAFLLVIPLYPKFPLINIPNTYVAIRLEDIFIAALALYLVFYFFSRIRQIFKKDIEKSILVYLIVGFISLFSAVCLTKSVLPSIGLLHWVRRIQYFIPFFAGLAVMETNQKDFIQFVVKILILLTVLLFIYGFGQKYFAFPVIITQNQEYAKGIALRWVPGSHINATFAGHYDLATFLVLIFPIFINLFFLLKGKAERIILAITIFCGFWLLANTVSRISVVSLFFGVSLSLFILKKYKEILIFLAVGLLMLGTSADLRARYIRVIQVIGNKIKSIVVVPTLNIYAAEEETNTIRRISEETLPSPTSQPVFEDRSSSIRLNVEWPRALRAFSKNPLLGTGYSSITLATDNDYLRLIGEVGILGFLSFTLIIFTLISNLIKVLPYLSKVEKIEKSFLVGFIGGFSGILINAFFIDVFEASKFAAIFWLLSGLGMCLARSSYEQNN